MEDSSRLERTDREAVYLGGFELVRRLGAGGGGTVYEARDVVTGARVALKSMRDRRPASLLNFKREFRSLSELSHPNLVRFGGLFEEAGHLYFTMELVEGVSLLRYLRPGERAASDPTQTSTVTGVTGEVPARPHVLGTPEASRQGPSNSVDVQRLREAMAQLAGALIALHAAGLVHRDVKPENVLVSREGRVVLLDFGLAVNAGDRAGGAGTPRYMAPEQSLQKEVTAAADWYSFGVILYEAIMGKLPQSAEDPLISSAGDRPRTTHSEIARQDLGDLLGLAVELLALDARHRPGVLRIADVLGIGVEQERKRASPRSRAHFAGSVFVARGAELATLHAAAGRARDGRSCLVHVEGESGIGKSALLRAFGEALSKRDPPPVVLSSRCYEREALPYRGADGVIDALVRFLRVMYGKGEGPPLPRNAAFLCQVFPVFGALGEWRSIERPAHVDVDPSDARQKGFHALREVLTWICAQRDVVIQLDDVQWIDAESAVLLSYVLEDPETRVLLILASRPISRPIPHDAIERLAERVDDVSRIFLAPLSEAESTVMAEALLGRVRDGTSDPVALARLAAGHPLFLHELVHDSRLGFKPAVTLEGALSNRLEALAPSARRLLETVSLACVPLSHAVSQLASRVRADEYLWTFSNLRDENLLISYGLSGDDVVEVYHDRVRELVVEQLAPDAQRAVHRHLAETLVEHAPSDLEALAHHFSGAQDAEAACRYASSAADRAMRSLSFEHAARLFELALRFESRPMEQVRLNESLGEALANAGRGLDSAKAFQRAATSADSVAEGELRRRAADQLLRAGYVQEGSSILFALLKETGVPVPGSNLMAMASLAWTLLKLEFRGLALASSPREGPAPRLALDACWAAATSLSVVHHVRATEFQGRALLLALEAGDADRVVKAAALLAATLGMADGTPRKVLGRLRDRAHELATLAPSDGNRAWLMLADGVSHLDKWDFRTCEQLCGEAEALLARHHPGATWELATARAFTLWSRSFRGDFLGAARNLQDLIASARVRGDRYAETSLILSPAHLVGLAADRSAEVRSECEATLALWPSSIAKFQHMSGTYVLAQVDLYEAKYDAAWARTERAWGMLGRAHLSKVRFQRVDLLGLRARATVAQAASNSGATRKRWLTRVARCVKDLRNERVPAALAFAHLASGAACNLEARKTEAVDALDRARQAFGALGMEMHAGMAELSQAAVAQDFGAQSVIRSRLAEMGVVNPARMLRVWVPGINLDLT